jgi:soluble lytic murein transglycosylase
MDESKVGKEIHRFFHSQFYQIPHEQIKKLTESLDSKSYFLPFKSWSQTLFEASTLDANQLVEYCHEKILKSPEIYPYRYLYNNLLVKCRKNITKNIDSLNDVAAGKAVSTIVTNINAFLAMKESKIISFLKKIKSSEDKNRLSYHLTQYYHEKRVPPPKYLLSIITIDTELNSLIAKYGYSENGKESRVYRDLKRRIKNLYNVGGTDKIKKMFKSNYPKISKDIKFYKGYLNQPYIVDKFLDFSLFLNRNNYHTETREIISVLQDEYTISKKQKDRIYFNMLWSYIQENKIENALSYIDEQKILENFSGLYSKTQYWTAYIIEQKFGTAKALPLKEVLIRSNPVSYYATVTMNELQEQNPVKYQEYSNLYLGDYNFAEDFEQKELFAPYNQSFERIKLFTEVGAGSLVNLEVQEIKESFFAKNSSAESKNYFYYYTTNKLHDFGAYLLSFRLIFDGMEQDNIKISHALLKTIFPRPFEGQIANNKKKLDEKFIFSLIRQESGFNPQAKSPVGATGLMQLMPATARRYKKGITKVGLTDPNDNLEIGTSYLEDLAKRYDSNIIHMLSAYNAGEGRIDRWKKNYLTHDKKIFNVELIPFNETRKYVKLIMRNMYFYKLIEEQGATPEVRGLSSSSI